jgi:hypothetical protein
MPDTYAHYTFGEKVLENLPNEIKEIVNQNRNIFNIGLQGPDIFFYYKPLLLNKINSFGFKMHNKSAMQFFTNAREVIKKSDFDNSGISYILGFICHFTLDSQCHPYINRKSALGNIPHSMIETEFERFLMQEDGLDPIKSNKAEHLYINNQIANTITSFYKNIKPKKIKLAVESMRTYSEILEDLSQIQGFIDKHMKSRKSELVNFLKGLVMPQVPFDDFSDSNLILKDLYVNAVSKAVDLIKKYYRDIFTHNELDKRFHRTYN